VPAAATPLDPGPPATSLESKRIAAKGWSWLVARLAADGVPWERAARAFADPRMPPFDGLFFNPEPAEPKSMYRAVLQARSVAQARACRGEYARAFDAAEARTGVPAEVVAAILHVETRCGRNTGGSLVLFGLARLAMANEPDNLERNLDRRAAPDGSLDPALEQKLRARAAKLDGMFYPEVRAVFELADRWRTDPLSLRGSSSGAFGYPQFLPTSYLAFGADGNGDGRVDLYDVDDAATSAAWFLASHGWHGRLPRVAQRRVIWHYNRSDAYIDAVLGLADKLLPGRELGSLPVVEAAH
jgi:membrane-bound lytic murein transglycosylase B